jgi:hypothetical protein
MNDYFTQFNPGSNERRKAKKLIMATHDLTYNLSAEWREMESLSLIENIHPKLLLEELEKYHGVTIL